MIKSPIENLNRAIERLVFDPLKQSRTSCSCTDHIATINILKELRSAARNGLERMRERTEEKKVRFFASLSQQQQQNDDDRVMKMNRRNNKNNNNVLKCSRRSFVGAIIPGDTAVEVVLTSGLFSTLNIYNTLLIGRLIVTWFPSAPQQIVYPLATICDPYLNLFRGIIPPLGGIDLSPILAFTALNFFTSTAAALPCEIDGEGNVVKVNNTDKKKKNEGIKLFKNAKK